jgi:ZIP family zinc transporter
MFQSVVDYFTSIDPLAALYASLFTWFLTALGAFVFMFKSMNLVLDGMLGFTGGVMVAASFEFIQP